MRALLHTALAALLAATTLLAGCERPPVDAVQRGYRGTGMELVYNPRTALAVAEANQAPAAPEDASPDGPKARDIYKNVPLLGHLSVGEFTRQMVAITAWISPVEGCNYCHVPENLADDGKYTKVVARRMIQMTQHVNADWKAHVAETGVTCYTCHRGKAVPENVWFVPAPPRANANFIGDKAGQNTPLKTVGLSSLPNDPFGPYLLGAQTIGVGGATALPSDHVASIVQTEQTYGLMMHLSNSLGVNCTYCHNTRNFKEWDGTPPQRTTAWHGIRMARDLNNEYIVPLTKNFPASRLGPTGDVAKINCATCHHGVYKPLYGAPMAKAFPALQSVALRTVSAPLPPPISEAQRSVLYFGIDTPVLEGEQAKGLDQLVASMIADKNAKARISGYHSASGDLAHNEELAKQRAFTVRDAMLAAGVPESQVILDKPAQTAANVAGEDPTARRVEVVIER